MGIFTGGTSFRPRTTDDIVECLLAVLTDEDKQQIRGLSKDQLPELCSDMTGNLQRMFVRFAADLRRGDFAEISAVTAAPPRIVDSVWRRLRETG